MCSACGCSYQAPARCASGLQGWPSIIAAEAAESSMGPCVGSTICNTLWACSVFPVMLAVTAHARRLVAPLPDLCWPAAGAAAEVQGEEGGLCRPHPDRGRQRSVLQPHWYALQLPPACSLVLMAGHRPSASSDSAAYSVHKHCPPGSQPSLAAPLACIPAPACLLHPEVAQALDPSCVSRQPGVPPAAGGRPVPAVPPLPGRHGGRPRRQQCHEPGQVPGQVPDGAQHRHQL